jgi:hypothetical protein
MAELDAEDLMLVDWFAGCALIGFLADGQAFTDDIPRAALRVALMTLQERQKLLPPIDEDEPEEPKK